jgi:hypothetical protein
MEDLLFGRSILLAVMVVAVTLLALITFAREKR